MPNIFLIADPHFYHENTCIWLNYDGTKMRPFSCADEMNEAIVDNYNKVVGAKDKVYILGDLLFNKKHLPILGRLKGDKVLIKGNHDTLPLACYTPYFRDIRAYHKLDKYSLTHIPIHPESIKPGWRNIHGHLHYNLVKLPTGEVDKRYINVSVEQINYTPISFEVIKKRAT